MPNLRSEPSGQSGIADYQTDARIEEEKVQKSAKKNSKLFKSPSKNSKIGYDQKMSIIENERAKAMQERKH